MKNNFKSNKDFEIHESRVSVFGPKHPELLEFYNSDGNLILENEIIRRIAALHYKGLVQFFRKLAGEIAKGAVKDRLRGRLKLGRELHNLSLALEECHNITWKIWNICRPHMENKKET